MAEQPIRSIDQFRRRYLPKLWEQKQRERESCGDKFLREMRAALDKLGERDG